MNDGCIELAAAIVKQAMSDYKAALKGNCKEASRTKKECERFFLSDYGQMLTAGNGERIIEMCKEEVKKKQRKRE